MLRRFDQTETGGRNHLLSMQSLLSAEGYYTAGYAQVADIVRRISDKPEHDLPAFYRQAVFNAVLGNTDDHLKNFAMLHGIDGWRLTPAFDLLPDVAGQREHVLHFGRPGLPPTREILQGLAGSFGLSARKADVIRRQVVDAVMAWRTRFAAYDVTGENIERLAQGIEHRVKHHSE